ncbi:MAG: Ig-like domain-containing protein [Deltaproteobacteria bacterium]|nr:MAG: Ig-like domain-containing protein [Deltaproteobacteria bacterium]
MKKLKVLAVFLILIISFSGLWTWKHRYQLFSSLLPKKGDLKVLTYSPTKEEVPISTDGITIMFDRAMVPLTTLDQGKENAIPLEITPEVEGSFHWLGTHGFIFRPKNPLRPATKYTITLPAGIPSEDGFRLKEKLQWEFTTILPRVESFGNKEITTLLPKKASITLRFNMAMNRKDVEEKLSFSQSDTPLTTQRKYEWLDDDHILQITFTENLPWGATIKSSLPEGVLSARGTLGTSREYSQTFMTPEDTMKITRVWAIHDYQDEKNLKPSQEVHLKAGDSICYEFSQGINKKSFEKAFHAQSSDDSTAPYFYFSYYDSFSTMSAKGPELLEGYKQACAVFLEKFNQSYTFSVKPEVIESLSGAPLKTSLETYKVKTDHATPQFFSNLTKNIISYKGPMQLHYRSLNLKSIQAKLYRLSKNYYSENIRNWGLASEMTIDSKTKLNLPLNETGTEIDEAQMKADYHQEMALTAEVDQTSPLVLDLNQFKEGKPLPGIYLLEISGSPLQNGEKPKSVLSILQLTSVGIATKRDGNHLLVWTTDLETGQPISTSFHVEAKSWNNGQKEEVTIPLDGVTDPQGLSLLNLPTINPVINIDRFCIEIPTPDLASYSCDPAHQFPEYHYPMGHGPNYFAYMYTDRPIYRPGQKVYFSSFVREVRESRYLRADPKTSCELNVTDAAGTEIYKQSPCVLGNAGIVSGQFDLENREDLPRGTYEISIKLNQQQTFTRAFQVSSYRKPSFKVDVQTKEKEIISGDTLKADVVGSYYFGSPLRKSPTRWSIMTSTYLFSPEGFSDYNFIGSDLLIKKSSAESEDETYSSEFEYDVVDASYENKYSEDSSFYDNLKRENQKHSPGNFYLNEQGEKVQNTSKLSEKDILNIEYKTDLKKYPTSQILSVEASVSDPSHQEVSSMEDIIVHKGSFYLGIKPNQWIYGEKEKAQLSVVSLDTQGKKSPRKSFSASLIRRDYKYFEKRNTRGFWELVYEPQDVSIKTISEKTDEDGKANLSFDVPSGGFYRVVLKANDHGNEIQSAAEFSAWGSTYVPWRLDDAEKIELVPDKSSYKIGDTAKVLIKSLVPMTKALLTYERGHLLDSKIIDLGGKNAPYIEVPIMEGMIPNFYLSVVAHAGRDTTRPPLLFYGETELHIEPESKRLMISLTPDRTPDDNELPVYKPGESVKVHVETKDPQGKPQKAHVIVSVADESVLKLLNYQLPDLIKKFYYNRGNNVKSTSSLFSLKAGDGGTGQSKKRHIFKDTAHFEADVMTNDQGQADFAFKLPDDLTTWVIEAIGITESKTTAEFDLERQQLVNHSNLADLNLGDKTFVGSQRTKILSTQPVVMRMAFPRFLVWGDTVRGNVIVTNRSSQEISGKVHLEIKGSMFEDNKKTEDLSLALLPHEEKILPTNLKVGTEGKTSLSVSFLNEKQNFDSLEVSWPVLDRFAPEVTASSGVTDTLEKEALLIPPNVLKDRGGLDVSLKASLSMATASSMRHLIYYPFGCSEQKSATLLAYLVSDNLSEALGETYFDSLAPLTENEKKIPFSEKMKLLEEKTQDLIDELEDNFQNSDGGMKYWPSSFQSDVFASAQVFWALSLAQQLGFSVDDLSYSNLKSFLSKWFKR